MGLTFAIIGFIISPDLPKMQSSIEIETILQYMATSELMTLPIPTSK